MPSSKLQLFLSLQRHHIRQDIIIFQTASSWNLPPSVLQQVKRSNTRLGIIQASSTLLKIEFQRALAISQWSRRWSTYSLFFLHMEHNSITMTCFLDCPWWGSYLMRPTKKKHHFQGNLIPPNIPPRERSIIMGNKNIVVWFNIKWLSIGRNPT
jgi:hypothetical protein